MTNNRDTVDVKVCRIKLDRDLLAVLNKQANQKDISLSALINQLLYKATN